jgi:hypothetical protein
LRAAELEAIRKAILDLRGFIEAGSPVLERRFLEELGGRLFDLVIRSQVRDLFITATAQRRDFVPFELFIESSTLASWPWEYLFDTGARMSCAASFIQCRAASSARRSHSRSERCARGRACWS